VGLEAGKGRLAEAQDSLATIQAQIDENTARLGTFARRQELLTAISVLEGRLQEATFESAPEDEDGEDGGDELPILNAIVAETEDRSRAPFWQTALLGPGRSRKCRKSRKRP